MFQKAVLFFLYTALCCSVLAQEPVSPPSKSKPQGRRSSRGRATLPPGIFGAEKPVSPDAAGTILGGTVPALWEIEHSTPEMDDDHYPALLERNTMAPPVPGKVIRYVTQLMQYYDLNTDGVLQEEEWKKMPGAPQAMDIDGDHKISLEEMIWFLAQYGRERTIHRPQPVERYDQPKLASSQFQLFRPISPPPVEPLKPEEPADSKEVAEKDLTMEEMEDDETLIDDATYEEIAENRQVSAVKRYDTTPEALRGVPAWFLLRDRDGDGQVSLKEFAPLLSAPALALFGRFDKNGDGFITPDEVRTPPVNETKPSE